MTTEVCGNSASSMWRAIERYNDKLDAIRRLLIESWTFECRPDDDNGMMEEEDDDAFGARACLVHTEASQGLDCGPKGLRLGSHKILL
jgi:hypothetical protein